MGTRIPQKVHSSILAEGKKIGYAPIDREEHNRQGEMYQQRV